MKTKTNHRNFQGDIAALLAVSLLAVCGMAHAQNNSSRPPPQRNQATPIGGGISSTVPGGNWSDNATWSGGVVPTSTDNVTIVNGSTVTINSSDALSVTVQGGGILQFEDTVARTLTVGSSVTINSGGTFRSNPTGTQTGHVLSVGENLANNGTLDFSTNANTAGANITFTGPANNTFGGSGATTNIRTLAINKGTSNVSILELNPTNLTVQGATTDVAGYLTLTNGTFKISGTFAMTNRTFTTATYTIPASCGIWLDNPNFTIAATASGTTTFNNGLLRISQGTYNIGVGAGDRMRGGTGAVFTLEGGTVNVSGAFVSLLVVNYTQTGGTLNVGTVGNNGSNIGTFELNFGSFFTMSGGTINLINPATGLPKVDYRNDTSNTNVITGGELVVGATGAPASSIYNATGQVPSATINPTQTMNVTGFSFFRGTTLTNNGLISGASNWNFASLTGAMTYGGTGFFGTAAAPYGTIAANSPFSITLNAPITCLGVLLFQGGFINSNQITLGNGGASATNIQIGGILAVPAATFDVSPVHNQGTGGQTLNYASESGLRTTGVEINPTRIVATLQAGNPNNLTIAGGNLFVSDTLILGSGKINTSAANLLTVTGTAGNIFGGSATAYVNGPLAITLPASLVSGSTYRFPIGKGAFNLLELVNPTTNAGGTVVVQAEVFDVDSGGTAGTGLDGISHSRYWQGTINSGAANFTDTLVRLTEIPLSGVRIGQSATQTGTYNFIGSTAVGNTVLSGTITSLDYFVLGFANLAPGTYNVGIGASYPTLTAAVADLNSRVVTGPVTLSLTDATYAGETFPIAIAASSAFSSTNTVTIKPAPGVSPSLSGSSTSSMINLNGADWVIIDGSNTIGGTSRDLTIANTNTATNTAVIRLTSLGVGAGATNNTVKNTNLVGSTVTATAGTLAGVFSGGAAINTSSAGADNDNNTIQNNKITKTQYGIYTGGQNAANKNIGTFIAQNELDAASPNNITTGGILANFENGIQIVQNDIGILKHDGTSGTNGTAFGIALGTVPNGTVTFFAGSEVTNASITANRINGITQLNPGSNSSFGIVVNSATSGTTRVFNNMLSGISSKPTASNFSAGIVAGGGTGSTTQIYANSVSMTGPRGAATFPSYGLAINSGDPVVDVRDNIFYNTQTSTGTGKMYAIGGASTTFANMTSNFNDFFISGTSAFIAQTGGLGVAGTDRPTLADWQAVTGKDANSISADPLFISTADLHITCTSPAADTGTPLGAVTNDFDGDPRSATTPDMGADEIAPPEPTSVVSRKTHGGSGPFNIDLLAGEVECRSGGVNGDYEIVATFAGPATLSSAGVTSGTGSVVSVTGDGTDTITVQLTGVADVQQVTLSLNCLGDAVNSGNLPLRMGVLIGDTTNDSAVGASDVGQTKSNSGQTTDGTNFRTDVTTSGAINASDIGLVKSKSGNVLPP